MEVERTIASAPRATRLAAEVAGLQGPCIGCTICRGLCPALIEALTVPDIISARSVRGGSNA